MSKKRQPTKEIVIRLALPEAAYVTRVSTLSGVSVPTVIAVILAIDMVRHAAIAAAPKKEG